MKRISTVLLGTGLAMAALLRPLSAAAERINPADVRQNLFGACFISEQEGWVIGDLGRILYTTDGAKSFERLDAGTKRAFSSIACFSDKTIVLVGKSGIIFRSTDGGRSWQQQKSITENNLLSVSFASKQVGVAVGDAGTIVRTQDGGTTWQKVPVPEHVPLPEDVAEVVMPGDILFYDVTFATAERGWIVGEFGVILTTTDGGASWVAQQSPVQSTLFGVTFADANNGWAVGLSSTMVHTRDGGQTWQVVQVPLRMGLQLSMYAVLVRGQYGWAVGESGLLLNTKDGGESWQLTDVPIQLAGTWFRGLGLVSDGRGVIVGADGMMLTTDRTSITPLRKL